MNRQVVLEIKSRVDLVHVIKRDVPELQIHGKNWSAHCPFHEERTPSFFIMPEQQRWKCYGCQLGGDIFDWHKYKNKWGFKKTLSYYADLFGLNENRMEKEIRENSDLIFSPITEKDVQEMEFEYLKKLRRLNLDLMAMASKLYYANSLSHISGNGVDYTYYLQDQILEGYFGILEQQMYHIGLDIRCAIEKIRTNTQR